MKSHPKSRLYVGRALEEQDALLANAITPATPDKPARDYRMIAASIGIGVFLAAGVVALIIAVITSGG